MQRIRAAMTFFAVSIALMLAAAGLSAQTTGDATASSVRTTAVATPERIKSLQQRVEASTDLSDADVSQIAELAQQALADLKAAEQSIQQAHEFEQRAAAIEQDRIDLERGLSEPNASPPVAVGRPVSELESERVEVEARIAQLENQLKESTVDPAARSARRKAARTLVTELPLRAAEIDKKLTSPALDGETPLLTEARRLAIESQKQLVAARLNAAQRELALFDAEDAVNLPTLRRDTYTRRLNAAQEQLDLLGAEVNRRRQEEAEQRAREARQAAIDAQPLLKEVLKESEEIIRSEQELRSRHEDVKELLQHAEDRTEEVNRDAREAERLDREVGLEKMGIWLRKQRDSLVDVESLREQLTEHTGHLVEAELAFYERRDQLAELADVEARADVLTEQAANQGAADLEQFRAEAIQVFRSQSINLLKLVDEYDGYTATLADLDRQQKLLDQAASEYSEFLDERILWVRSHQPITLDLLRKGKETLAGVLSPQSWLMIAETFVRDAAGHGPLYAGVGLLLIVLWIRRRRHSRRLRSVAQRASGRVTTSIAPTIECLMLTSGLAIIWPGLILFLAWRLYESTINSPQQQWAAMSLAQLASVAFLVEFVRQSMRPSGLAEAHFHWDQRTVRRVRGLLRSLMIFGLPLATVVACLHQQDPGSRGDTVERLFFVAAMVVLLCFAHGLLHPSRGALCKTEALQDGGWIDRFHSLWYLLGIGVPLVLAAFSVLGYYDTAVELAVKVQQTVWVLIAGIYLHALFGRWLMLRHRRLRIELARETIAAAHGEQQTCEESGAPLPEAVADGADLESSNKQSHRLVRTSILVLAIGGLWLLWADVLPALRFLDRWPLWETTQQVVRFDTDETTGETDSRTDFEVHAVTIASLAHVLFIIVLTTTAARNLPGLLEISVLHRLPIDRSTAYAVTSLTRYALILMGVILASQTLGIGWSKVQWLAAALTFGLGFGLQEIFANFVSGLIILFEQPVRVGDVVTIDNVSGVVNRIRIRATTIVDWDRKEYIVPNREFITGRLLNWTLSDKLNRVVINVGVAYGTDTSLVRATIMQVLDEHENVLADPAPLVSFESFGDSALDFVVRAYLPSLDQRLETIHQLHVQIHDRLAAAGIEIPFPQRDLHVRNQALVDQLAQESLSTNGHSDPSATETADRTS